MYVSPAICGFIRGYQTQTKGNSLVGQDGTSNLDDGEPLRRHGCEVRQVLLDLPLGPDTAQCLDNYAAGAQVGQLLGGRGEGTASAVGEARAGDDGGGGGGRSRCGQASAPACSGPEGPHGGGQHGC